jgi:perosamine synthetase
MEPWIDEEEKRAVSDYMSSGAWLTEFSKTREFENRMATYVGSKHACAVCNGTVSLAVALMALGLKKDDEVIVPDFTMIASANAVVLAGAKPVLVDVNRRNLCLDLNSIEEAVTEHTRAIMHVSLNGRSPGIEGISKFAQEKGLFLVEDAAQSLGSRQDSKHVGTFGDVGSFSLSYAKIITTGQGGVLVTNNDDLQRKILQVKDFGRTQGGVDYHATMGFNFKFTDLQAVIGIEQLKKLEWRVQRKKEMFKLYRDLLQGIARISFVNTDLENTTPWFIDIFVEEMRSQLAKFLEEKQIGTRPFYPAIHTQPPYANAERKFENSEWIAQRGLWLPSSSFLTDADIEYVCESIRLFFRS